MNNKSILAYLALIAKILIYGSSSLFTRHLLLSTDVLDVISLRFLLTALVFVFFNIFGIVRLNLKGKDVKSLLLCSIFEPILYFVFETIGISMSPTIIVAVISALSPISSIIVARVLLKEKTNLMQTVFVLLEITGVLIIVICTNSGNDSSNGSIFGVLFMFLAILSGSLFAAFSRKSSKEFKPIEISCFSAFTGCIGFNFVNIARHAVSGTVLTYFKPLFSVQNLIGFAFLSILSSIVAVSLGNYALSKIPISRTAAFTGLSTIYTIILGVLIYNEVLHTYHIIGTILIIISVYGVNKFAHKASIPLIKRKDSGN